MDTKRSPITSKQLWFCICIWMVSVASFFTYFYEYNEPAAIFWDENYHITSAEKYLQGVFFQETHPPVGKFFLALGEWMLQPNRDVEKSFLTKMDKIEVEMPEGFSYYGYRFFPALISFLTAPLLFVAFYKLSNSAALSTAFTVPYVFDNALVVHFRGAMLDGIQIFFMIAAIICFLFALDRKQFDSRYKLLAALFGLFVGLAAMTKENGLVLILLGFVIMITLADWKKITVAAGCCLAGLVMPVLLGWYLHFNLATHFATEDTYELSPAAVSVVERGATGHLANFPRMFFEANKYILTDNTGAPVIDEFDETENGSWWYLWPVGGRSINYRWMTPDGEMYHYLYLQSNPVVWFSGLFGVVLAVALVLARVFGTHRFSSTDRELVVWGLLTVYFAYMGMMAWIERERVMYLYHYFIPLIISFFLFALCVLEAKTFFHWQVGNKARVAFTFALAVLMIASFNYFSPLTYYKPMRAEEVEARALLHVWHLRPE